MGAVSRTSVSLWLLVVQVPQAAAWGLAVSPPAASANKSETIATKPVTAFMICFPFQFLYYRLYLLRREQVTQAVTKAGFF
jgi:hypothetical protein